MAEPTGTARQEAEKLVATVLAMASQAGLGGPPEDRDPAASTGLTGLTDKLSGLMDQFLGGTPDDPPAEPSESADRAHPTDRREAGSGMRGEHVADRRGAGPGADDKDAASEDRPGGAGADQPGFDWREAYQHTLDSLGAQARQAAGRQLWAGATRFGGWSTGSAECCVCPICRAIAGLRNPTPEQAERLATGAGDFASGVASLLRAFSTVTGATGTSTHRKPPPRPTATPDQAWSTATRRGGPADATQPGYEVHESDDPWTAATRTARPQPAARAAAPQDTTARTAADQAAVQSDATGPEPAGPEASATPLPPSSGDPWAAATRARPGATPASRPSGKEPADVGAWVVTAEGAVSQPAPERARDDSAEGPTRAATQTDAVESQPEDPAWTAAQGDPWAAATRSPQRPASGGRPASDWRRPASGKRPASDRRPGTAAPGRPSARPATTAAAQPSTDRAPSTHPDPHRDSAAAAGKAAARTGKEPEEAPGRAPATASEESGTAAPSSPPSPRVTGATDVWAAVTAANGDTAGDTGVAHTPSVDHDVPGTAPAAEAAEGRGAGSGDDARPGDAV